MPRAHIILTVPAGKVADIVTEGEAKVTSKKGNEIKKNASEDDPAVVIERSGVSFIVACGIVVLTLILWEDSSCV